VSHGGQLGKRKAGRQEKGGEPDQKLAALGARRPGGGPYEQPIEFPQFRHL
jgi:hypothetical protein